MNSILAFGLGGPYDVAIVGGIIILLFGGAKIAGFGKSLGQGIRDFKHAAGEDEAASSLPASTTNPVAGVPASTLGTTSDKNLTV
jgi:sec-independent protein translocase protein TatA